MSEVLSKAGWLRESSFTRHYLREIDRCPTDNEQECSSLWKARARPVKAIASSSEIRGLIDSGKVELLTSKYGYKQRSKQDQYVFKSSALAVERFVGVTYHEYNSETILDISTH